MPRHRSSAAPLAWLYCALIVYASLYPFAPWRLPGVGWFAFVVLPWPRYWTGFDLVSNLLGYIPFGALVFVAIVRGGGRAKPAAGLAFCAGTGLSFTLELLQNFLPQRVASNVDLGLNSTGALIGVALGLWIHAGGGIARWQAARDRWFIGNSAGGLALLLSWPAGMLFPLPVPLGQGQVLEKIQQGVAAWLSGTPIAPWFDAWADIDASRGPLSPGGEFALIALGLVAPCLVSFSIARAGWRRFVLVVGAALLGWLTTTLSTALNFGPQHLLAWSTPQALAALGAGIALACVLSLLPRRAAAGMGLVALTALVIGIAQAPSDPFFAQSLQNWEQGRFIRFYGVARWVGWLWPYAATLYLLARLGARDDPPSAAPSKIA